jgi:hypothetical protein
MTEALSGFKSTYLNRQLFERGETDEAVLPLYPFFRD